MSAPQAVTASTWDSDVVEADTPVIVDFWAQWCAPCRAIAPVLDEIARDHPDRIKVAKVNVDEPENEGLVRRFGVLGIPLLVVMADGVEKKRIKGFANKQALLGELAEFI